MEAFGKVSAALDFLKRKKLPILITLTVAIFVCAFFLLFFFVINRWSVTVTLNGDSKVVLEAGEKYEELGAVARGQGSVFFKTPKPLEVSCEGKVDTSVPGKIYTVKYTASYVLAKGSAERTVVIADDVPPVIELKSDKEVYVEFGKEYAEAGYTASDNVDGDITDRVTVTKSGNKLIYTVEDSSGNVVTVERIIHYVDVNPPAITLWGDSEIVLNGGNAYAEPGYSASDREDGDLTEKVTVTTNVNPYVPGEYTVNYEVMDSYGNVAKKERKVTVKPIAPPQTSQTTGGKNIYLTFDDGPSEYTPALLDVLAKYNVKVTFFVTNQNTDLITREFNEGHSVGIHTASHVYSEIYANDDAFFADLNTMSSVIESKTGKKPTLMRFPGGSSNVISRKYNVGIMSRLTTAVTDMGYQYFDWNVSSGDAGGCNTADAVFRNVVDGCTGKKNSVVLQHDTKKYSVDAVERIIAWGLSNGYTFLPLTPTSPTAHHGVNN